MLVRTPCSTIFVKSRLLPRRDSRFNSNMILSRKLKVLNGDDFEMRWATPEDFNEMRIMPRMLLDHLPENVMKTIDAVLDCQQTEIGLDVAEITVI